MGASVTAIAKPAAALAAGPEEPGEGVRLVQSFGRGIAVMRNVELLDRDLKADTPEGRADFISKFCGSGLLIISGADAEAVNRAELLISEKAIPGQFQILKLIKSDVPRSEVASHQPCVWIDVDPVDATNPNVLTPCGPFDQLKLFAETSPSETA